MECPIPKKPETIGELHKAEKHLRQCAINSNEDKREIKKKIEGGVW